MSEENGNLEPADQGGRGSLLFGRDKWRKDARLAARILSLGVVPEEQAEEVLRGAFDLAIKSVNGGKARDYAAAMSVPIAAAKLEIEHEKLDRPQKDPPSVNVNVGVTVQASVRQELLQDAEYLDWLRTRAITADVDAGTVRAHGQPGSVANGAAPGGTGPSTNGNGSGKVPSATGDAAAETREE